MSQPSFTSDLPRVLVDDAVRAALREDLGRAGDITSQATLPKNAEATAFIQTRETGVLAGMALAESAFRQIGPGLTFRAHLADGEAVQAGAAIATISGPALLVLSAERVALNFLTHLSGIASATRSFADAIAHTKAKVTCTRKILPGLRAFQKHAVRMGGGSNHRFGLDDAILIKDNHIAVRGGVVEAVNAAKAFAGHLTAIEIEVDTLDQFAALCALDETARPDVVLLDNMAPGQLADGVAMNQAAKGRAMVLEASGGIKRDTIAKVAESGVDYISSGWLTSSAPSLDVGLDITIT